MLASAGSTHRCPNGHDYNEVGFYIRKSGERAGKRSCKACHAAALVRYKERCEFKRQDKLTALGAYGQDCACCGEKAPEFLAIDHVHGGGNRHRAEIGVAGSKFYVWLRKNGFPPGYRVLCHNCNIAMGHYGYCPHQEGRESGFARRLQWLSLRKNGPKQREVCSNGHVYSEVGVYVRSLESKTPGKRECRACKQKSAAQLYRSKKNIAG